MARLALCVTMALWCAVAVCDDHFYYTVMKDEISNKETRYVGVVSEDKGFMAGGALTLYGYADGSLRLKVDPEKTIFPDGVQPSMYANVSIRSTAMDEPITKDWDMRIGNYDMAAVTVTPDEARKIFGGESVTVQLNKTGHRVKYRTSGKGYENLKDAVEKVLEVAKE